ncbi:MAG: phage integrase N-terminal SAM-like domain-containing protein [Nevskia sp.]|jgi:hypothetical protein|nr:phage integrase N-terminal SAM-like domain-containing protein [Nevskia sp.]
MIPENASKFQDYTSADVSAAQSPRLLEQVRALIRALHYSLRTEDSYLHWIRRFILFHGKQHPRTLGAPAVEAFLSHLATDLNVAANTQNLALCVFYRKSVDNSIGQRAIKLTLFEALK